MTIMRKHKRIGQSALDWARARVTEPPHGATAWAMTQIADIANAGSDRDAERRCAALLSATVQPEARDATFRAAQGLRELGRITDAEAAWVFRALFQVFEDRSLLDMSPRRWRRIEAAFYTVRGEARVAQLFLNEPDEFDALCTEGLFTLVEDKRAGDPRIHSALDPELVAVFRERLRGPSASRWALACLTSGSFPPELRPHELRSAVAAVRQAVDAGELPARDGDSRIGLLLLPVISALLEEDREWRQLSREMHECLVAHGIDPDEPEHEEPRLYKELKVCRERREGRVIAYCYRLFGEHERANRMRLAGRVAEAADVAAARRGRAA